MTTFEIDAAKHDQICTKLGAAAGQVPGGWSIGHENLPNGKIRLTFPAGVLTQAQFDAIYSAHDPNAPVVVPPDPEEAAVKGIIAKPTATTAELLQAVRYLAKRAGL